ncbi:BTAD domain-containing putative transcriptional regulator [Nonomuraea sp. NPDC049152]|uniref:BTAD domain-containing putative transcriptional regulator n=1 Tax=Nonomuraea sp. NPDC049152 TaxID=3154350 RepID=UPI0033CAE474
MRFGVLGPLAVWADDGSPVRVPEAKVRALLVDLLVHEGRPVPMDRLIDDLWGGRPSGNPVGTLQARVSQLRRALGGPETVVREPAGYRLAGAQVDAGEFTALVARARESTPQARAGLLADALALWRGPAYADHADEPFVAAAAASLEEARLTALEDQAEVRLALGEPVELGALVDRHPLRERLRGLHMRALYSGGRQSEALESYAGVRERLAEELGVDPGKELAALYEAILRQDPSLETRPSGQRLPLPLTELIGREDAVAEVRSLLDAGRLVTLTGPGGVGKTRLAMETAGRLEDVRLVELAATNDPVQAVIEALGIRDDGASVGPVERLVTALRDKRLLLVMDNCEHVIDGTADLVATLLRAAGGLRVLATSREPLAVQGERVWPVPPLETAQGVRLFAARAVAADPGFALDDGNAETVATIVERLDGLPLALELAATRVRALGVRELAARLDDRFRVLGAGRRGAPGRQQTLRAVIDWSWELLSEAERVVLRRLAVHADGCLLEAAEQVCAEQGVDVLGTLAQLVDRSLVSPGPRYRLLETVRAYGLERLEEAGEAEELRRRHAAYYTELAERAELRGAEQGEWLRRLDAEGANLRVALERESHALRLVNALGWYWFLRGRRGEASRAIARALSFGGGETGERALAAVWQAGMTLSTGDQADAVPYEELDRAGAAFADWFLSYVRWAYGDRPAHEARVERALTAFRELGDRWGTAAALDVRSKLAIVRGDLAAMEADGERSVAIFQEVGDGWGQSEAMETLGLLAEIRGEYEESARWRGLGLRLAEELGLESAYRLSVLGRTALLRGDYTLADDYHERARRLAAEQSYKSAEEHAVLGLGLSARRQGRLEEAERLLRPWLTWLRQVDGQPGLALILAELGFAAEQRGDTAAALALHREGYACARASGDPRAVALALEGLAGALPARDAARFLGTAGAIRESVGAPLPPAERGDVERIAARALAELGEQAYAEAHASGQRELGTHLPRTLRGGPRQQPAAQRLDPLGHADQPEPAAQS